MNARIAVLLLGAVVTQGCVSAGTQTVSLTPAPITRVENETDVLGNSDVTWDRLVQRLSRSYYVINNIDKASRLINVSFSSNSPADYIDCGTTTRSYTRGGTQQYTYAIAQSSSYKVGEQRSNLIYTYDMARETNLEGRVNIYVAPKDSLTTSVAVNARYVLSIVVSGFYQVESLIGVKGASGPIAPTTTSTIAFSTNQPNTHNVGTSSAPVAVTCYSTGRLEREIVGFGNP